MSIIPEHLSHSLVLSCSNVVGVASRSKRVHYFVFSVAAPTEMSSLGSPVYQVFCYPDIYSLESYPLNPSPSLQRAFTAILTSRMVFHLQTRPKIIELGNASTVCPASMGVPSVPIEFRDSSWDGLGEGEEDGDREDGQHRD